MDDKCGIRNLQPILDLFDDFTSAQQHESDVSRLKKYLYDRFVWDCFYHHIVLYDKTYKTFYYPVQSWVQIAIIIEKTAGRKVFSDTFFLVKARTTIITRRKKSARIQNKLCSTYDYRRFFLDEENFIPSCVALRLAGYVLREICF